MKQNLKEAGYYPKEDKENMAVPVETVKSGEKKKRYAHINGNDLELPLDLKGVESGDKLLLTCLVNVDEISSVDKEKSWNGEGKRFDFSILKCGCEKTLDKEPSEMSDEELDKANKG